MKIVQKITVSELSAMSVTSDKVDPTLDAYFMQFAIAARLSR